MKIEGVGQSFNLLVLSQVASLQASVFLFKEHLNTYERLIQVDSGKAD